MTLAHAGSGRYFLGPDRLTYKWKFESTHCWVRPFWFALALDINFGPVCEQMKPAESDVELVRYHMKNVGIFKEAHPAYLDVSSSVVWMLDHIILTFVYVESVRQNISKCLHCLLTFTVLIIVYTSTKVT